MYIYIYIYIYICIYIYIYIYIYSHKMPQKLTTIQPVSSKRNLQAVNHLKISRG